MERLKAITIEPGQLVANTPYEVDIQIPLDHSRWSLFCIPKGTGNDVAFEARYYLDGAYYPVNPAVSGTAVLNSANIVTSEDLINRVKVILTPGAAVPSNGIELVLNGLRSR